MTPDVLATLSALRAYLDEVDTTMLTAADLHCRVQTILEEPYRAVLDRVVAAIEPRDGDPVWADVQEALAALEAAVGRDHPFLTYHTHVALHLVERPDP